MREVVSFFVGCPSSKDVHVSGRRAESACLRHYSLRFIALERFNFWPAVHEYIHSIEQYRRGIGEAILGYLDESVNKNFA